MKRFLLAVLLLVLIIVPGCGGPDPKAPPDIKWQEDVCDFCNMVIEDKRFAAGYRLKTGEQRIFDDIGDMVLYLSKEKEQVASVWLRDFQSDAWLPAESAWVVEAPPGIQSPMGYGLAAVVSPERGEQLARRQKGVTMTWQQLLARGVTAPRAP